MNSPRPEERPIRVLVVAAAAPDRGPLASAVAQAGGGGPIEVVVIAPALNSRIRTLFSDERDARRGAEERLDQCLSRLSHAGVAAHGRVGDADPMMAIRDAQVEFSPHAIVVATGPGRHAHRHARDLAERARTRTALPVTSVEVSAATGVPPRLRREVWPRRAGMSAMAK
jgi:hypothetical protein